MHDDLIDKFEGGPTAKDIWDKLKFRLGQTFVTRFRTLHLKWVQYEIDTTRTMVEHLRTMSDLARDLKVAGRKIFDQEQVLNATQALPKVHEHWKNIELIMIYAEHLRTFVEIQSHLEMEEEP